MFSLAQDDEAGAEQDFGTGRLPNAVYVGVL